MKNLLRLMFCFLLMINLSCSDGFSSPSGTSSQLVSVSARALAGTAFYPENNKLNIQRNSNYVYLRNADDSTVTRHYAYVGVPRGGYLTEVRLNGTLDFSDDSFKLKLWRITETGAAELVKESGEARGSVVAELLDIREYGQGLVMYLVECEATMISTGALTLRWLEVIYLR